MALALGPGAAAAPENSGSSPLPVLGDREVGGAEPPGTAGSSVAWLGGRVQRRTGSYRSSWGLHVSRRVQVGGRLAWSHRTAGRRLASHR